jgi:hypothetical protein
MPHRVRDTKELPRQLARFKRDTAVDAAFVSSPDGGRGRLRSAAAPSLYRAYISQRPSISISYASVCIF